MLWKIYFWILLVIFSVYYLMYLIDPQANEMRIWDSIDIAVWVGIVAGVYGFCWKKKIYNRTFWKVFSITVVLWTIFYDFILYGSELFGGISKTCSFPQPYKVILMTILALLYLINILWAVALFMYGFRKSEIWAT